jgi:hypothetical protein
MYSKEKLYETFGELLYAVTLADGKIQDEEINQLKEIIKYHPLSDDILWSFNYEKSKNTTVYEAYAKAIDIFKFNGPAEEYKEFEEILNAVANACNGIGPEEKKLIDAFRSELTNAFMENENI